MSQHSQGHARPHHSENPPATQSIGAAHAGSAVAEGRAGDLSWPRVLFAAGGVLLVTMLVHLVALAVTGGAVTGPVSLRKPATFAETGWLTAWCTALIMTRIDMRPLQRHVVGTTVLAFGIGETAIMAIQAWRGVPSHYNFTTPFDATMMRAGAGGLALAFLVGMVTLLTSTFRDRAAPRSLVLGVRCGIVVLLFGCVIGFVMISNMSGVFQGSFFSGFAEKQVGYLGPAPATVGHEYLLLRPYTDGGDLVLLHAIGIHCLPFVALPAVMLSRIRLAEATRTRYVLAIVAGVAVAMAVLAEQAFGSLPLSQLSIGQMLLLLLSAASFLTGWALTCTAYLRAMRNDSPSDPFLSVNEP